MHVMSVDTINVQLSKLFFEVGIYFSFYWLNYICSLWKRQLRPRFYPNILGENYFIFIHVCYISV
jgi:hypothetical protein